MVKLERAPGYNPETFKQETKEPEKPKKMADMNAVELEAAILENLGGRFYLGDAKVFLKAVDILGKEHALVSAVLRIKNSDPAREEKIGLIVSRYKQAMEQIENAIKFQKSENRHNENREFKKAA